MAAVRFLPSVLAWSLTLAACESSSQKATNDEIQVAELVCSARNQVDQAVAVVNALTPEPTIAQAEFSEYPDQVKIFCDAVEEIRE